MIDFDKCLDTRPKKIAIIGMGRSAYYYIASRNRAQGVSEIPDEVWGINFTNEWLKADKIFLMDGIEALSGRGWSDWAERQKTSTVPIITPVKLPDFPCTVQYPLEWVIETVKEWREFHSTVCYMVAYAIAIGVKRIDLFGCDFEYPDKKVVDEQGNVYSNVGETGKSALTFWLGIAVGRGIAVNNVFGSLLNTGEGWFYGYPEHMQPKITVRRAEDSDAAGGSTESAERERG